LLSLPPEGYKAWEKSLHTQMVRPIAKGDFKNVKADLTAPGAPKPDQYDWAYAIGGWYKEERYAFRDAQGNVISGEFEYNKPLNHFTLRKDKAGNPERLDWFNACGGCHATGANYKTRQFNELNIGCEACHGPGALHVKDPKASKVAVDKTSENCGQCHMRLELCPYSVDFLTPSGELLRTTARMESNRSERPIFVSRWMFDHLTRRSACAGARAWKRDGSSPPAAWF
jgi:hypothetical protein